MSFLDIGPSNIVNAIASVANNERFPIDAVAVVDADSEVQNGSIKLPGEHAPEKQILLDIRATAADKLALRLDKSESSISNAIEDSITLPDHHEWPSNMARLLGESTSYMWQTMCNVWVNHCADSNEMNSIKDFVERKLQE